MTSIRVWSKGSARGVGPAQSKGVVRAPNPRLFAGAEARHLCKCGCTMIRCDDCGAWWCKATGHAPHVCGGKAAP